jgi:hypothetical protein
MNPKLVNRVTARADQNLKSSSDLIGQIDDQTLIELVETLRAWVVLTDKMRQDGAAWDGMLKVKAPLRIISLVSLLSVVGLEQSCLAAYNEALAEGEIE